MKKVKEVNFVTKQFMHKLALKPSVMESLLATHQSGLEGQELQQHPHHILF